MGEERQLPIHRVAITGGLGNLATKLFRHLATQHGITHLVGLDLRPAPADQAVKVLTGLDHKVTLDYVECDLADGHDDRWRNALTGIDALVHFAADNPYPEASWLEAARSLDMTLHVTNAALTLGIKRVVFATSNHVMGRYKDDGLWETVRAGELTPELPPGTGAIWHTGTQLLDSTPYATAKLMGERVCKEAALRGKGATTFACIRIGWCQPGDNLPTTLSAAGTPTQSTPTQSGGASTNGDAAYQRADRWFKEMWLSNRDFLQLFTSAIVTGGSNWPDGYILVNGMSANQGMKWNLDATRHWLGYQPQDNVYA